MSLPVRCWIDPRTYAIGVRVDFAVIHGVKVGSRDPELDRWKRAIQRALRDVEVERDPVLAGYRRLLARVGKPEIVASPEYLLRLIQKHGKLPQINTVVDAYNIVSAETRAVVSAHDADKLTGAVRMILLDAPVPFEPLGSTDVETLAAGEFTIQDDMHALCRLNAKQSRRSSVSPTTENLLLYAQGNPALEGDALTGALDRAVDTIIRWSGGRREPVHAPESQGGDASHPAGPVGDQCD